jgi:transposase
VMFFTEDVLFTMNDQQWDKVSRLIPESKKGGRPPLPRRKILNGIFWIPRTGAPWRDLPKEFGAWQTVWRLFDKWNGDGTLDNVPGKLQGEIRLDSIRTFGALMAPSYAPHGAPLGVGKKDDPAEPGDHAPGRSQGGYSTKLHILCDAEGHPLYFHLTPGQAHESKASDTLLEAANSHLFNASDSPVPCPIALAGDKGYRADWIDNRLMNLGIYPVIPSKSNEDRQARPVPFRSDLYRKRNIVERVIGWLRKQKGHPLRK